MENNEIEFCTCGRYDKVYAGIDDFARWDICYYCDKPKEDTLIYFNHYDGEEHDLDITDLV